ncbi:MAG: serine hydrolase [Saprospiraceae bacterium]|nr:serine hydrolase [Saprospiraceae bacterium]
MRKMFKILMIVLLAFFFLVIATAGFLYYRIQKIQDTGNLAQRIDQESVVFVNKNHQLGLAIAVIKKDTAFFRGFGFADREKKTMVDSSTVFEIGSITKIFTAELAEILSQKGIIDWQKSVADYMMEDCKQEEFSHVTLLDLASHHSGLPRLPKVFLDKMKDECRPYESLTEQDLLDYLQKPEEITDKNYQYSNLGFGILGMILERVSMKSFDQLLKEEITASLNMNSTGVGDSVSSNLAQGYDANGKPTCYWNFPVLGAAGAIRSNIKDLVRFGKAQLAMGKMSEIFTATRKPVGAIPGGQISKGWHIDSRSKYLFNFGDIVWHNGGTGGFSSYIGILPKKQIAIIVLANQSNANSKIEKLAYRFLLLASKVSFEKTIQGLQ